MSTKTVKTLAFMAVVWTAGYAALYVGLVEQQGNQAPAWFVVTYVGVLALAAVPLVAAGIGRRSTAGIVIGATILGLAALVGLLSIGILLVPAVIMAVVVAAARPEATPALLI